MMIFMRIFNLQDEERESKILQENQKLLGEMHESKQKLNDADQKLQNNENLHNQTIQNLQDQIKQLEVAKNTLNSDQELVKNN